MGKWARRPAHPPAPSPVPSVPRHQTDCEKSLDEILTSQKQRNWNCKPIKPGMGNLLSLAGKDRARGMLHSMPKAHAAPMQSVYPSCTESGVHMHTTKRPLTNRAAGARLASEQMLGLKLLQANLGRNRLCWGNLFLHGSSTTMVPIAGSRWHRWRGAVAIPVQRANRQTA